MILARCPECQTTFRVTPDQLKARAGKVRCGQCRAAFNALDALVDDPLATPPRVASEPLPTSMVADPVPARQALEPVADAHTATPAEGVAEPAPPEPRSEPPATTAAPDDDQPAPENAVLEATAVGLVAARDTREVPGYSRWSEQPLAGEPGDFKRPVRSPRWPAVVATILLSLALLGQAAHRFRGEIAARWPETRDWLVAACAEMGCDVPLPRQAELISIEGSELQADAARGGLLILQATLKNRAPFAQAYPALELTLTDTQDSPVTRRVLPPREYLPGKVDPSSAFAANGDLAVKLWVESREAGAAGYRLYVFYP